MNIFCCLDSWEYANFPYVIFMNEMSINIDSFVHLNINVERKIEYGVCLQCKTTLFIHI